MINRDRMDWRCSVEGKLGGNTKRHREHATDEADMTRADGEVNQILGADRVQLCASQTSEPSLMSSCSS